MKDGLTFSARPQESGLYVVTRRGHRSANHDFFWTLFQAQVPHLYGGVVDKTNGR